MIDIFRLCNIRGVALSEISMGLQLDNPVSYLVHETRRAFISEDTPLQTRYARIYPQLRETSLKSDQLIMTPHQRKDSNDGRNLDPADARHAAESSEHHFLENSSTENPDSTTIDIYYDCISRLSEDDSSSSIDKLRANFRGSPHYYFETKSSVYPEQYSVESLFSEKIGVLAIHQLQDNNRRQKYFLMYAETPRKWHRITLSVVFDAIQGLSTVSPITASDNHDNYCKTLSNEFQNFLYVLLSQIKHFYTITNLSLSLRENIAGQIRVKSPKVDACEDVLETELINEDQILQDIQHLNCPFYFESEVVILWRISTTRYQARVGLLECIEQKAPFASAGRQGENGFFDFCEDLKLLCSLRGCPNVVQFIRVVLDQTKRHLKGFLYESPKVPSLSKFFVVAQLRSEDIPWPVREIWSRQIIKAVSDIHARNKIVGLLNCTNIGLRADGSAVLTDIKTSQRHIPIWKGELPPELRNNSERNEEALQTRLSFHTDIFQLGLRLWLLAEHRAYSTGYLCAKAACTIFPRYSCTADHANPVDLPSCCSGIPPYINDIIKKCRARDPISRPSTCSLLNEFTYTGEVKDHLPGIVELLDIYASRTTNFFIHCDECGAPSNDLHFHCKGCCEGNFDLCQDCVELGVHCFDLEHVLVERVFKNGRYVEA